MRVNPPLGRNQPLRSGFSLSHCDNWLDFSQRFGGNPVADLGEFQKCYQDFEFGQRARDEFRLGVSKNSTRSILSDP